MGLTKTTHKKWVLQSLRKDMAYNLCMASDDDANEASKKEISNKGVLMKIMI